MDRGAWWATQSMQFQGVGASEVALVVKNLPASAEDVRDTGLVPGLGRSPGEGHDNPLQYSCLENPYGQRSPAGIMGSKRVRHD